MAARPFLLLCLAALLPACSAITDPATDASARHWPSWGGPRPVIPAESVTAQRVRQGGAAPDTALAALRTEPGDMWPAEEAPRATLANPDEALRGIGNQRMGLSDPGTESRRPARGSSSPPPDALSFPSNQIQNVVPPEVPIPPAPPRPLRADGQVVPTTRGPVTTTGGAGNVSGTISPQGPGVAVRDGNTTTIFTPGRIEQVPTPR